MTQDLFLLEAKRLHEIGVAVHWLKPKDKVPVESGWTSGPRHTFDYLERHYKKGMNIGIRLGVASKITSGAMRGRYLAVIDADLKSNEPEHNIMMHKKLDELCPDWRKSPIVLSGRANGSLHIYASVETPTKKFNVFQSDIEVKTFMGHAKPSKKDLEKLTPEEIEKGIRLRPAFEIDFMCEGSQVACPPSIHPLSGKAYTWDKIFNETSWLITPNFVRSEKFEKTNSEIKDVVTGNFTPVAYDLDYSIPVSEKIKGLIVSGAGLDEYENDRSRAFFAATLALCEAGATDDEVLSVLTDTENYLGATGYDHTKSKDRSRAAHWLNKYTLQKVRQQKSAENMFLDEVEVGETLSAEDAKKQETEINGANGWMSLLDKTENGKVRATNHNITSILKNTALKPPFIFFDEFYSTNFFQSAPPWSKQEINEPTEIKDIDITKAVQWFSTHWSLEVQHAKVIDALDGLAYENKRHPIREHMRALVWDKKPRLDSWLKKYMGANEDPFYLKIVGRKLLIAFVTRIFSPGCKFDQIVILQGGQGAGKSTALRILATDKWFTDKLGDISNKDALMIMHRHALIEIGELDSMRKSDVESFKLFASTQVDVFRKPYGHLTESYPRQSVMIGTTNKKEFLVDETGNRRFWPVGVADELEIDSLKADRDQLIAEAVAAYDSGELLWFENWKSAEAIKFKKLAEAVQNKFTVSDDWESEVEAVFQKTDHGLNLNGFTMLQLWSQMQGFGSASPGSLTMQVSLRVGKILRSMGFDKKSSSLLSKGKDQKLWFKKDDGGDFGF